MNKFNVVFYYILQNKNNMKLIFIDAFVFFYTILYLYGYLQCHFGDRLAMGDMKKAKQHRMHARK